VLAMPDCPSPLAGDFGDCAHQPPVQGGAICILGDGCGFTRNRRKLSRARLEWIAALMRLETQGVACI